MYRLCLAGPCPAGAGSWTRTLIGVLLLTLTACGDDNPTNPGNTGGDPVDPGGLVEFYLDARSTDGQPLPRAVSGAVSVAVGETFLLEVGYSDLREDGTGLFALAVDLLVDQAALEPVLSETQNLIFGMALGPAIQADPSGTIVFGLEGSGASYNSTGSNFADDATGEIENAMQVFGYTRGVDYEVSQYALAGGDIGFQVRWSLEGFANVDAPDILVQPQFNDPVPSQVQEFSPFGPDGVTINDAALRFNVDTVSRDFNGGEPFYTVQAGVGFDPADGLTGLSMVGQVVTGGVPEAANDGMLPKPFHAFSVPVRLKSVVDDLEVSVAPTAQVDEILMYGREEAVAIGDIWVDGDASVVISGI